jgi:hypothetical protein
VNFLVVERGVAGRAGEMLEMRAIAPSMPPNAFQGRQRPTSRFYAAGANGKNMRWWWSARREAAASDSSSSKVHRHEG